MNDLIVCCECGHKIATSARSCPGCGAIQRAAVNSGPRVILRGLLLTVAILGIATAVFATGPARMSYGLGGGLALLLYLVLCFKR